MIFQQMNFTTQAGKFLAQITSFYIEHAVMFFVNLFFFKLPAEPSKEFRHLRDSPAHHELKLFLQFLGTLMDRSHVLKFQSFCNCPNYSYFFTDAVNKREL